MLFLQHDTKNMERVCSLLSKMMTSNSSITLQCQIITTLTCLLAELSVASRQQRVFEGFVELLLEIVARANNPSDAILRNVACECLRELELLYPGLLHQSVGNFYVFAQTESTFAYPCYVSLFTACLAHAVMLGRSNKFSKQQSFLLPCQMTSFEIPENGMQDMNVKMDEKVPEFIATEIRKCIYSITANSALFIPTQLFRILNVLLDFQMIAGLEAIPSDVFKQGFLRLMDLGSPLLMVGILRPSFVLLLSSSSH